MARSSLRQGVGSDAGVSAAGPEDADFAADEPGPLPPPGTVIANKYRLERVIGKGGMGAVWSAHHLQLDLPVAIKLLNEGSEQATLSERMKLEARAAARLVHPAIVRVFDIEATESGAPFIVMELLTGESLADVLDRGRLSAVQAVKTLLPIAEALALSHAAGIVHRDLKPQNVFVTDQGDRLQPKLLDFGIAKLIDAEIVSGKLTGTGVLVGSPDYMSPEQARGLRDVDHRSDIWSFSVVLYEAVAGAVPFSGENYNALMRAIVEDEPPALLLDAELDQQLAELIQWGLAKDREARPASIQELGRELARWLLDRGEREDVCGSQLGPKWITRTAPKSLAVLDDSARANAPAAARGDTLVSARLAATKPRTPKPPESRLPSAGRTLRVRLAYAAGALLLLGGLLWRLVRAPAGSKTAPLTPAVASSTRATTPIQIASTPPAPAAALSASSVSPERERDNSVSKDAATAEPSQVPAKKTAPRRPTPAAQPMRDVHDEASELLQAY